MIETICHDHLLECLKNEGQHKVGEEMLKFSKKLAE